MQNTDPRPLRWASLPAPELVLQWYVNASVYARRTGTRAHLHISGLGSIWDIETERAQRERDMLLAGMEARYQVRGGLEHTDVETLDAAVQQTMHDGDLMDLTRAEAAALAAALIRGYACANPVANARDSEYAACRQKQRGLNAMRRFTRRVGWTWASYRAAVMDMAERFNALARDDEFARQLRAERIRHYVAAGIVHESWPTLGGDYS